MLNAAGELMAVHILHTFSVGGQVEDLWQALEFPVLCHKDAKDVFVLGGLDEIQAAVDEGNIHISTILSSRNCGPIKSRVEEWAKNLDLFSRTLVSTLY